MDENIIDESSESTEITSTIKKNMKETARWMKFLGIIWMIIGISISAMILYTILYWPIIGFFTLIICSYGIYLGYLVYKSGADYSSYLKSNSSYSLEAAFANQKSLWKNLGILVVAGIILFIASYLNGSSFMNSNGSEADTIEDVWR